MFSLLSFIYWDPDPEVFFLPILNWPILWYGVFFAFGFAVGFVLFYFLLLKVLQTRFKEPLASLKKKAMFLTDRLTIYMIISTIIGARLGHFLFYESPSDYLSHPLELFWIRKGGLASHGAALGIVIGLFLFARRYQKELGGLGAIRLLDLVCVPTAFAGASIRIGNFINQEILGTKTDVPWAVVFGHPMDHSLPAPRHPVQLYEALCYLATFFILYRLTFLPKHFLKEGRLIGLFLVLIFGSRFFMEFLKVEQSFLIEKSFLTMGQILSIIPILVGFWLLFRSRKINI